MKFKFRKKEYKVERDAYQFILSEQHVAKSGDVSYNLVGYYSDPNALIKKLLILHLLTDKDAKEMVHAFHTTCKQLGKVLEDAVKRDLSDEISTISEN